MNKFQEFLNMKYSDQAIAFLNAFWGEYEGEAEKVWGFVQKFVELDIDNKSSGKSLDEFNAHRFLEAFGETKGVVELRDQLRENDITFTKRISLVEYLLFRYKQSVSEFVKRPQGDNSEEIAKAQALLEQVQAALDKAINELKKAKEAEAEQKKALAEVNAQQDAYDNATKQLTQKSEDQNLGLVARNRAKNELAQHLSQDNLPLSRAKLTLEAATKKAEKARISADKSKAIAEDELRKAEEYLEEVKRMAGSGAGQGAIWWVGRELEEKKKYMPKKKGGNW